MLASKSSKYPLAAWTGFEPQTFSAGSPKSLRVPLRPCSSMARFAARKPKRAPVPSPEWGSVCPAAQGWSLSSLGFL